MPTRSMNSTYLILAPITASMFGYTGPSIVLNRQVRSLPCGATTAIAPSAVATGTIDEFVRIAERDGAALVELGATYGGQAAAIREGQDERRRAFPGADSDDPFFKSGALLRERGGDKIDVPVRRG